MNSMACTDSIHSEPNTILDILHASAGIRRHCDLLHWMQGDMQKLLPHEILIAAWGDPKTGRYFVDVVSTLPGMRTGGLLGLDVTPFINRLFLHWDGGNGKPRFYDAPEGFVFMEQAGPSAVNTWLGNMRSAVVHGIRDQRGQQVCLYAMFLSDASFPAQSLRHMELLLPHIDAAMRQVTHLAMQRPLLWAPVVNVAARDYGLSEREQEIANWVKAGKTNHEIGIILGISAFTVKNHLQRIFQKVDVTTRAQLVDRLSPSAVPAPARWLVVPARRGRHLRRKPCAEQGRCDAPGPISTRE